MSKAERVLADVDAVFAALAHASRRHILLVLHYRGGEMTELAGATGELFLDQQGRVHRRLAWAQFQRGEAIALPAQVELGGPIQDISDDGALVAPDAADDAPWDPVLQEL